MKFFFLIVFFFCSCIHKSDSSKIKSANFDLSEINLNQSKEIKLDGEWKFIWNDFLDPVKIQTEYSKFNSFMKVPSSWNQFEQDGKKVGGLGFGTYLLKLKFSKEQIGEVLILRIPHFGTSYKLYVNEKLISENGKIGTSKEESEPNYILKMGSFVISSEEVYITIHVSNFYHRKGGFRFDSIYLGNVSAIDKFNSDSKFYMFFLLGSLVVMSFYHFGLFFLRREDITALVFGIFCSLIAIRMTLVGDIWITSILPNFNWNLLYKIDYISLFLTSGSFTLFSYFIFAKNFHKIILKVFIFFYLTHSILVLVTKPIFFSNTLIFFQVIMSINSIYILVIMFLSAREKNSEAIPALIGLIFIVLTIINDLLYNNEIYITGFDNLLPFGVFIFIFSQSFILSQLFSNAFKSVKVLSSDLSKTNEAYSKFVPIEFLNYLNKDSIMEIKLGDQVQKEMTILFSDMRSFTLLSEKLTPKENFNFLNSYLSRMNPIIQKNSGFIDKYIGDAILGLFPNQAADGVNAAIEMQKEIVLYNKHRENRNYSPIQVGSGIHTGNLMLGIIGAADRMEGTVIADSVNLASRIEGMNKIYNLNIIISDTVLGKIDKSKFQYRLIDKVKMKGKTIYTTIYEIFDFENESLIELKNKTKKDFELGIESFLNQSNEDSKNYFEKVLQINPNDQVAKIYLEKLGKSFTN